MSTVQVPSTKEILAKMKLSDGAKKLPSNGLTPLAYFSLLVKQELYSDALGFIARLLPKREAVWWACLCIEHVGKQKLPKEEEVALGRAVHWVLDPSEENRRAAREAAIAAKKSTAAGSLGMGVFWTGGSISPAGQPEVLPAEDLAAKAITGALKIAAASNPSEKTTVCQRQFLALALDVAEAKVLWRDKTA